MEFGEEKHLEDQNKAWRAFQEGVLAAKLLLG